MQRLQLPATWNDSNDYDVIVARRNPSTIRKYLKSNGAQIKNSYASYVASSSNLGGMAPIAMKKLLSSRLMSSYKTLVRSKDSSVRSIHTRLLALPRHGRCPYCRISDASTLDHYLPKERFPEFSIMSRNLVAVCKDCNHAKGSYQGINALSQTFHPYFDGLPDEYLISASINASAVFTVSFALNIPNQPPDSLLRLQFHFNKLQLANRYRKEAITHLASQRYAFDRHFARDGIGGRLREELELQATSFETEYGKIHWLVALYRALASSAPFCGGGFRFIR